MYVCICKVLKTDCEYFMCTLCGGKLTDSSVNNLQMLITVLTVCVCHFIATDTLTISTYWFSYMFSKGCDYDIRNKVFNTFCRVTS